MAYPMAAMIALSLGCDLQNSFWLIRRSFIAPACSLLRRVASFLRLGGREVPRGCFRRLNLWKFKPKLFSQVT